jgi:predicted signal transduction protein with EAL and GGDEF domain
LAVTDPLTGLTSHRRLLTQLQASINRARNGRPFALMVVELANHAALARELGREGAERALVPGSPRGCGGWCVARTPWPGSGPSILRC